MAAEVPSITAVVFDLGGVLIDWNPEYLYNHLILDDAARQHFFANVCTREWHEKHDAGVGFAENAQLLLAEHPQADTQELILAWGNRFDEMFGGSIQGTVEILSELHGRDVPLYALTNWSHELFPKTRRKFPFLEFFKDVVVSGAEKVKKPDAKIYEILVKRTGLKPEEMVFIDDRDENLEPARKLGFTTIRFTSPESLRQDLKKFNLLNA